MVRQTDPDWLQSYSMSLKSQISLNEHEHVTYGSLHFTISRFLVGRIVKINVEFSNSWHQVQHMLLGRRLRVHCACGLFTRWRYGAQGKVCKFRGRKKVNVQNENSRLSKGIIKRDFLEKEVKMQIRTMEKEVRNVRVLVHFVNMVLLEPIDGKTKVIRLLGISDSDLVKNRFWKRR